MRPFRWSLAGDWIAEVSDVVGEGVLDRLREHAPPPVAAADEGWLRRALGERGSEALVGSLAERFRSRHDAVVAFHAGRPADPGSYRARGVLVSTPERLLADAREVFPGVDPLLPRQDLSLIDGRLAFNLDERFLLESDTFYLLYGSHFLLGLAVQLRRETGVDHLPHLRARGTPALLTCLLPLDYLPPECVPRICRLTLHRSLNGGLPGRSAFDLTIHRSLEPALVLRAEEPADPPDHLYGGGDPLAAANATA